MTNTDTLRGKARAYLEGIGLTDRPEEYDDGIHGWRCEFPDRYGRCGCLTDAVDDLADLIRTAQAEAWEEGHSWGWEDARDYKISSGMIPNRLGVATTPNPYRDERSTDA